MTHKQQRFVEEYLVDGNATRAAKAAGYSEKTAHVIGDENLEKPEIAAAIAKGQQKVSERTETTVDSIMADLADIQAKAAEAGQFSAATRAAELRGKHIGMFSDITKNINLDITAISPEGRQKRIDELLSKR